MKHHKPFKGFYIALFYFFIGPNMVFGQSKNSPKFQWKTFLGRNLNPAISIGAGGGHMYHTLPVFSLKTGRLSLNAATYDPFIKTTAYSFQADLELIPIPHKKWFTRNKSYFTLGAGLVNSEKPNEYGFITKETLFALAGINSYLPNKRSKLSIKVGPAYLWTNTDVSRGWDVETHDWVPYGEISFKLYLLKIREKQLFTIPKNRKVGYLAYKEFKRDNTQVKYPKLSKWFNPYWSNGVGLDRVLVTPAGGLKVGPFNGKFSAWVTDLETFFSGNINYDIRLKRSFEYTKYLSFGLVYTGVSGVDCCSGGSDVLAGGVAGLTLLKNRGRHGLEFKAGIGLWSSNSWSIDLYEPHELHETSSKQLAPIVGFSYNLYFFRLNH